MMHVWKIRRPTRAHRVLLCLGVIASMLAGLAHSGVAAEEVLPTHVRVRFVERIQVLRSVVRLSHVIKVVDGTLPEAWQSQVVAVLPPDVNEAAITQAQVVSAFRSLAPGLQIEWFGPEVTQIARVASLRESIEEPTLPRAIEMVTPAANVLSVLPVSNTKPVSTNSAPTRNVSSTPPKSTAIASSTSKNEVPPRVRRLVQQSVERALREAEAGFDVEIDWTRAPTPFVRATRIVVTRLPTPLVEGEGTLQVEVDSPDGNGSAPLSARFTPVPMYLTAAKPLKAGHIITEADLSQRPASDTSGLALVSQPSLLVGKQLRRYMAAGTWITTDVVGSPLVVHKQDLVEVRVQGGGVVIRTSGRAMEEGASGDLISVETLEPRRKLLARVVATGIVEILTRPPQVPQDSQ